MNPKLADSPPDSALAELPAPPGGAPPKPEPRSGPGTRRIASWFSFRNISALYVLAAITVVFSLTIPETFLTRTTWVTLLDGSSITAIAAVALVIPLSAGVFNLAIGQQAGLGSILIAWFMVNQGMSIWLALVLTLVSGAVIGLVCGLLVVKARIDSFIATLGVSSLLAALITAVSGGQQILSVPDGYSAFAGHSVFGLTSSVLVMLFIGLVVFYVLEMTSLGRRIYATGGNIDAARLAGVRTSAIVVGSLVACAVIASIAGLLVTSRLGNADPTIGPGYLLPAFTAAFLGSTQFRGGRFNVFGTLISVYVLALGVKGLVLSGAPLWISDAFNGGALIISVGLAKFQSNPGRAGAIRRVISRKPLRR